MAIDIPFADRYSLAILDSDYVASCSEEELKNAVHHFYLDTYEVDQNACSSPRILLWLDSKGESFTIAQQRWWQAVTIEIQKYDLAAIKVSRKYAEAWKFAMHIPEISHFAYASNRLYVYTLSSLSQDFPPAFRSLWSILPIPYKEIRRYHSLHDFQGPNYYHTKYRYTGTPYSVNTGRYHWRR